MIELVLLLVLLILSGVFSGSETALVNLSIARVEGLVKEHRHGARALHQLKRDPSRMLTTILIGAQMPKARAVPWQKMPEDGGFGPFSAPIRAWIRARGDAGGRDTGRLTVRHYAVRYAR